MEVVVLSGAESDLWSAWSHYEGLGPGLGARFDGAVRSALEQLVQFPASGTVYQGEFRRLLLRRYDYGIFYRIHGARLVVVAVLDLRQDPERIRGRLRG